MDPRPAHLLGLAAACALALRAGARAAEAADDGPPRVVPAYRIETAGFDAGEANIRAVLDSAAGELFRWFPDYRIEPFVVVRGHGGPITLFERNARGEIVMRLDTGQTYWSQYAYQFAHEFGHILCGFRPGYQGNRWFEETLCETASLFAMRAMARRWQAAPPYPNWRDYRDALRGYADDVIRRRPAAQEVFARGLAGFYQAHRAELERNPTDRELNGAMAVVFLHLFEEQPARWGAVRWLNATPAPEGESFAAHLGRWSTAVPEPHREFVELVARLYGVGLNSR